MQKFKTLLLVLVAFIFGLFSPNLVTYVLAHGGNTNFLHSCVKTSGFGLGSIRMILPGGNCNSNETPVDWTKLPWNSDYPLMCQNCDLRHDIVGDLFVGKDLSNALLQKSNLSGNDLRTTILTDTHLTEVQFIGANLQGQNLSNQDLLGDNFDSANLTNVDFTGANLSGTPLINANLSGANFTNAILDGVSYDNTICPDGTNSDNNGNTCEGHLTP